MAAAALLIAVTASLTWQRWPPDDASTFWHLQWESWPQGAGLFALGAWAGEAGSLEGLTAWAPRLGWTALRGLKRRVEAHLPPAASGRDPLDQPAYEMAAVSADQL